MNEPEDSRQDRIPSAAGRFYPAAREALTRELEILIKSADDIPRYQGIRAIISPHAGYVYSGRVAASAFAAIPPEQVFSNIVLIGSSHRVSFNGASVYNTGDYLTPLGRVKVNKSIADSLIRESEHFSFLPEAHKNEHCIEVQLPFVQYCLHKQPEIVPVIIGTADNLIIRSIAETLRPLFTPSNLFIISTDFSHYPSYEDACMVDSETALAITSGSPARLLEVLEKFRKKPLPELATSMCGWTAGLTLMYLTKGFSDIEYIHLMYKNSGDVPQGDRNGVVGYHSFAVRQKGEGTLREDLFNSEEQRELLRIARSAIESKLHKDRQETMHGVPAMKLRKPAGVFVSLHIGNELRGCIGTIRSAEPLCDTVAKMACSAAFNDPRFPHLTPEEYEVVSLEISVLTPLHKVGNIDEIIIGTHGLYIRSGGKSGVMLPQVASERGWSVVEFLEHTAGGKAGIGKDGWKDAEIFIFRAQIIKEDY